MVFPSRLVGPTSAQISSLPCLSLLTSCSPLILLTCTSSLLLILLLEASCLTVSSLPLIPQSFQTSSEKKTRPQRSAARVSLSLNLCIPRSLPLLLIPPPSKLPSSLRLNSRPSLPGSARGCLVLARNGRSGALSWANGTRPGDHTILLVWTALL